jgi:hypothetical protein
MKTITRIVLPFALGLSLASSAFAQTAPATPAEPPKRERPSAETMQRMQDGRIAMITTALKMTDEQKKLWAPVEAKIRESQAARLKRMETMGAARQPGAARPDMVERMERMSQMTTERNEQTKAFLAVFKPFHASLTDDQKKVIGPLMAQIGGGGRGKHGGHRGGFAMQHRGPGPQ